MPVPVPVPVPGPGLAARAERVPGLGVPPERVPAAGPALVVAVNQRGRATERQRTRPGPERLKSIFKALATEVAEALTRETWRS